MIEINGNPNRRDLSEQHARLVADAGVKICLNTDAHRVSTLDEHALRHRDAAPGLADEGGHREHAAVGAVPEAAQAVRRRGSLLS